MVPKNNFILPSDFCSNRLPSIDLSIFYLNYTNLNHSIAEIIIFINELKYMSTLLVICLGEQLVRLLLL